MEKKQEKLKTSERWAYALGRSTGLQFLTAMVASYVLIFFTDTFGVPAGAAGIIMLLASIWDAVNDPMMGTIADRTKSRWGKYRPYLLFTPIPFVFVTYMLFLNPQGLSVGAKIAWAAVFYVAYGMLNTVIMIPFAALMPAMTQSDKERNKMVSIFTIIATFVIAVVASFTLPLVNVLGGYKNLVLIVGIVAIITCWLAFAKTKERNITEKESRPLKEDLKELIKHKELLTVLGAWAFGYMGFQIMMASSVYYLNYYIGKPDLIMSYMGVLSLGGLVGIAGVLPLLNKIFDTAKKGYMFSQLITAILYIVLFFVGGKSIIALYVLTFFAAIFASLCNAYVPMTTNEMCDYISYETGESMNGIMASVSSFGNKLGAALSNGALAGVLAVTGYVANAEQTPLAMFGINFGRFLLPAISAILVIGFMNFYPVTRQKKKEIEESKKITN